MRITLEPDFHRLWDKFPHGRALQDPILGSGNENVCSWFFLLWYHCIWHLFIPSSTWPRWYFMEAVLLYFWNNQMLEFSWKVQCIIILLDSHSLASFFSPLMEKWLIDNIWSVLFLKCWEMWYFQHWQDGFFCNGFGIFPAFKMDNVI